MNSARARHLSFGDRMRDFDPAQGDPRALENLEPQHRPRVALERPIVLLDETVEILGLTDLDLRPTLSVDRFKGRQNWRHSCRWSPSRAPPFLAIDRSKYRRAPLSSWARNRKWLHERWKCPNVHKSRSRTIRHRKESVVQCSNIHSRVELAHVNRLFVDVASCRASAPAKALSVLVCRRFLGKNPHKECVLVANARTR
jgi:hypothetical protein